MYDFIKKIGKIVNSNQTRVISVTGNIYDLFYSKNSNSYEPISNLFTDSWKASGKTIVHYDLNTPVVFVESICKMNFRDKWIMWKTGFAKSELYLSLNKNKKEEANNFITELTDTVGKPTAALELLRQMTICNNEINKRDSTSDDLIIIIENSDMILPECEDISRLSDLDRRRIGVCHDWFTDPSFIDGNTTVILLSESRSLLNKRISRLPQIIEIEIPSPDEEERLKFIKWFEQKNIENKNSKSLKLNGFANKFAKLSAGLSIYALRQICIEAVYDDKEINIKSIIAKVESFIKGQLGDDVIEFKKPTHYFEDIIGFGELKKFLKEELIPRFQSSSDGCLSGAAVAGSIGSGKSFLFEAVATELDMPVLVLKNLRSQWFGQTDVIFERLRRVLEALNNALIFIDEADTQFGGVNGNTHETEKRLTGKIQAMMSDPALKGKVLWLLMTARIHRLSADIRRPGRAGDLIIPVLDPEYGSEDHISFIKWMVDDYMEDGTGLTLDQYTVSNDDKTSLLEALIKITKNFSAASFSSLRSEIKSKKNKKIPLLEIIEDYIPANIEQVRQYQTYQALINCTRKSLLPKKYRKDFEMHRNDWMKEIKKIEDELGKDNC